MNKQTLDKSTATALGQNWDTFRYFLEVARLQSISGAARVLDVSQPTVSRKVQELERLLSVKLIKRGAVGMQLTDAGCRILENIERIERETLEIHDTVRGLDTKLAGKVTLTAPEGFGLTVLLPKVAEFRQQYPNIDLHLLFGATKLNLINRDADVAIRIGDTMHASLVGKRIGSVKFGFYAHVDYLTKHGEPKHIRELKRHELVDMTKDLMNLVQVSQTREIAPHAVRSLQTNSVSAQFHAVCMGLGIGALPHYMATGNDQLVEILPDQLPPSEDLWMLTHQNIRNVARVRAVCDFFGDAARDALSKAS